MEASEDIAESINQADMTVEQLSSVDSQNTSKKSPRKRKRRQSDNFNHSKPHGSKHRPPNKKSKLQYAISSTKVATNIMKFRLGGSVSDPLNLTGGVDMGDECSTCAPSPVNVDVFGQPSPLPPQLQHDPLNLEGKVKNFPAAKHRGGTSKLIVGS